MALVRDVKSTNIEEYVEKWTRIIRKHSYDGVTDLTEEELKAELDRQEDDAKRNNEIGSV